MVPRPVGVGAPQCARCGKSVYMAEQVIGPYSRPYHKACLTCTVCNKRLDSTLLVEHEGDPYCKNCHKAHLGQGKGGFGLAVPLRPDKPSALKSKPLYGSSEVGRAPQSEAAKRVEDRLNEELSGINIAPRRHDNTSPTRRDPASPSYSPSPRTIDLSSRPTTVAQSIDHLVASGVDVPIPYARHNGASEQISQALYGDQAGHSAGSGAESTSYKTSSAYRPASPLKNSFHFSDPDDGDQRSSLYNEQQRASDLTTSAPPRQPDIAEEPAAPAPTPSFARSSSPISKPTLPSTIGEPSTPTRAYDRTTDAGRGLPTPQRKDPMALARERERGLQYNGSSMTAKTYSPRTTPVSPGLGSGRVGGGAEADQYGYSPNSALTKMGLGSTVSAAAVGTPLCARCERPVYFAEQKQAAGRKWHRACLRCDGCSTTLESGKLEEGPLSATYHHPTNVWCRTCYAKRFGPKGIGVAGMSLPETMK